MNQPLKATKMWAKTKVKEMLGHWDVRLALVWLLVVCVLALSACAAYAPTAVPTLVVGKGIDNLAGGNNGSKDKDGC